MIKSVKTFLKIIKTSKADLDYILDNIDLYYYVKKEVKLNPDGSLKKDLEGNIKYRILHPSIGELKFIQHRIKNNILRHIDLPNCTFGGVKGRNNISNAKCHKGKKFKFVTDLNGFFPSIKPFQVYEALIKEGFSPGVSSFITKLVTYKNQEPQGAPTSTHIANLVLKEVDTEILMRCHSLNITYTRFVDDLSFSSPLNFREHVPDLLLPILRSGFNISYRKTKFGIGAIEVTGIWVRNNSLDVSDKMKFKISNPQLYSENQNRGNNMYTNRVKSE